MLLSATYFSSSFSSSAQSSVPRNPRNATVCGETIYALTENNQLLRFNSDVPGTILSSVAISGLQAGESLLGIDYRPAVKEIYGLSNLNRLYIIDVMTGLARQTATLNATVSGMVFGVDFNPVPDRLRVVSDLDQNLRINVSTGETVIDGTLAFNPADANAGGDPAIAAAAYTNNFAGATATTLYGIDYVRDILVTQNPPNDGRLNTIGPLGVDVLPLAGFDIAAGSTRAFASLTPVNSFSSLYTINLATGAATLVGAIGNNLLIQDITVAPRAPVTVYGLTGNNRLVVFDSDSPGELLDVFRIRGLPRNEQVVAIDFRPANGRLYALGASSAVYTINLNSGRALARPVSPFSTSLSGGDFGFDFNPTVDRIRVVSDADQNLRLNPDTGDVAAVDGGLRFAGGENPNVVGSAYSNNFAGATSTTLYNIDSGRDVLVTQSPPNDGVLNVVGSLGVDTNGLVGFDIFGCDLVGYAALTTPGDTVSKFYRINLATGAATLIGEIGGGAPLTGIALR